MGVSDVCVMGLNEGKGLRILLRLRYIQLILFLYLFYQLVGSTLLSSFTYSFSLFSIYFRTDDLKGFRKIQSIRDVLFHELAHNEHSDHDGQFYMLMRQIKREVTELDWRTSKGKTTGSGIITRMCIYSFLDDLNSVKIITLFLYRYRHRTRNI